MQGSSFFVSRVANSWQRRNLEEGLALEGSGGSRALFDKDVTFGLQDRETLAGAYSRGL